MFSQLFWPGLYMATDCRWYSIHGFFLILTSMQHTGRFIDNIACTNKENIGHLLNLRQQVVESEIRRETTLDTYIYAAVSVSFLGVL